MNKTLLVFGLIFLLVVFSFVFLSFFFPSPKIIIKALGLIGFFLLCFSLILGPIAVIWPQTIKYLEFRKTIGVGAFLFLAGHFFLTMQNYFNWNFSKAANTNGIISGLVAFVILVVLALTSFDSVISYLGQKIWKFIHYFNYVAFVLSFIHFLLKVGGPSQILEFNFLEFGAVLVGVLTILLQVIGFVIRTNKNKQS
ncbi:MAG: ferric reductase-like transmembrane domain-containing protein [Candidatus Anstonellaceae archaeon]